MIILNKELPDIVFIKKKGDYYELYINNHWSLNPVKNQMEIYRFGIFKYPILWKVDKYFKIKKTLNHYIQEIENFFVSYPTATIHVI